mgnify:CR=1 FL=1
MYLILIRAKLTIISRNTIEGQGLIKILTFN